MLQIIIWKRGGGKNIIFWRNIYTPVDLVCAGGLTCCPYIKNICNNLLYKFNTKQIKFIVYIKSKRMSFGLTQVKLLYSYINKPVLFRLLYPCWPVLAYPLRRIPWELPVNQVEKEIPKELTSILIDIFHFKGFKSLFF